MNSLINDLHVQKAITTLSKRYKTRGIPYVIRKYMPANDYNNTSLAAMEFLKIALEQLEMISFECARESCEGGVPSITQVDRFH